MPWMVLMLLLWLQNSAALHSATAARTPGSFTGRTQGWLQEKLEVAGTHLRALAYMEQLLPSDRAADVILCIRKTLGAKVSGGGWNRGNLKKRSWSALPS